VGSLDLSDELQPKFPVRGHILSIDGDALMRGINFWTYQLVLVLEFWKKSFQPIIDIGSFKNLSYQPDLSSKSQGWFLVGMWQIYTLYWDLYSPGIKLVITSSPYEEGTGHYFVRNFLMEPKWWLSFRKKVCSSLRRFSQIWSTNFLTSFYIFGYWLKQM